MARRLRSAWLVAAAAAVAVAGAAGCARDTSTLTPEWQQRFAAEGIVRRADNIVVRHTRQAGPRDRGYRGYRGESGYKDRLASVVVTKETVLIHQGDRVLLEITARTRRDIEVRRDGPRIRIRAVGERVTEVFSFEPPDDAKGWVVDVRRIASGSNPTP